MKPSTIKFVKLFQQQMYTYATWLANKIERDEELDEEAKRELRALRKQLIVMKENIDAWEQNIE